jgi:hypothetical protein
MPNGWCKLRLRPPNLQSREPDRRSRQLDAVLAIHTARRRSFASETCGRTMAEVQAAKTDRPLERYAPEC